MFSIGSFSNSCILCYKKIYCIFLNLDSPTVIFLSVIGGFTLHLFRAHLEQLAMTRCVVLDDEAILTLMHSLPPSYRAFINSFKRQPGIILQSLITGLIREETLMKDMS